MQKEIDDMEKVERIICIIYGMTAFEVNNLTVERYNEYAKDCGFLLTEEVPGKPKRFIKLGVKKYGIIYNPAKLKQRQYVEILSYSGNPVDNMHMIMASLVQRVRFGFWKKNKVDNHKDVAEDMLDSKITDVYHTCVFFCKLYANSIVAMKDYLAKEIMKSGVKKETAEVLLQNLISSTDGFTELSRSQNLNE